MLGICLSPWNGVMASVLAILVVFVQPLIDSFGSFLEHFKEAPKALEHEHKIHAHILVPLVEGHGRRRRAARDGKVRSLSTPDETQKALEHEAERHANVLVLPTEGHGRRGRATQDGKCVRAAECRVVVEDSNSDLVLSRVDVAWDSNVKVALCDERQICARPMVVRIRNQ